MHVRQNYEQVKQGEQFEGATADNVIVSRRTFAAQENAGCNGARKRNHHQKGHDVVNGHQFHSFAIVDTHEARVLTDWVRGTCREIKNARYLHPLRLLVTHVIHLGGLFVTDGAFGEKFLVATSTHLKRLLLFQFNVDQLLDHEHVLRVRILLVKVNLVLLCLLLFPLRNVVSFALLLFVELRLVTIGSWSILVLIHRLDLF